MITRRTFLLQSTALMASSRCALGEEESNWNKIAPFFKPPAEFADDLGDFRSPLKFYDGTPVRTKEDWARRREEIRTTWHKMLGPWPKVIENPKIDYVGTKRRGNITQHKVEYLIAPGHPHHGYILVPDGAKEKSTPGLVVFFYEPETGIGAGKPDRDFALQFAQRGYVTFSAGHDYSLYYPNREAATIQPLSALAYGAVNAFHVLASRPEIDVERIGITGHSYGGKWAMFASCLYERFAAAAWSDPGIVFDESNPSINYWEPWYLGYAGPKFRKRGLPTPENPPAGLYPRLRQKGFDLHELHALMAPRPFLVSGGHEDPPKRWRALNHSVAVNKLLDYENRVAMTNRPAHSPNPTSNEQMARFFDHFLKPHTH